MRTLGLLCGIGALLATSTAFATPGQGGLDLAHPTVRLDTGIAVPVGDPQDNYFGPGGMAGLKLAFNLTPWLDVDPSVETIQLSENMSAGPGSSVGGTWALGLGARLKRPHNVPEGNFWGLSSPWIDAEYQYYNTGGLGRMGASVGVGLSAPLDYNRHWWFGPMLRGNVIVDGTSVGGTTGFDTRDMHVFTMGVELEFDVVGYKHPATPSKTSDHPTCFPTVDRRGYHRETKPAVDQLPPPHQDPVEVTVLAKDTIQFDFDSAVISDDDKQTLDMIAETIKDHLTVVADDPDQKKFTHIQVDGHASSENHPWAEKHNQKLSEDRAQAVVDYLVSKGVPGDFLTAKGFGVSTPVASNDTDDGRQANRRVEFELTLSFIQVSHQNTEAGGQ